MLGKITVKSSQFPNKGEALIYFVFENNWKQDQQIKKLNQITTGILSKKITLHDFSGKNEEIVLVESSSHYQAIYLVGLGQEKEFSIGRFKQIASSVFRKLGQNKINQVNLFLFPAIEKDLFQTGKNIALAFYLANYHFLRHKDKKTQIKTHLLKELNLIVNKKDSSQLEEGVNFGCLLVEGIYLTRDLVNEPASHLHPKSLVDEALKIEKESKGKISVEVLEEEDCRKLGLNAFLGVAQGSDKKPRFIILKFSSSAKASHFAEASRDKSADKPSFAKASVGKQKSICLIGKSITFDSGGISLKPSKGMEEMKTDMAGGATVLGVFKVLAHMDRFSLAKAMEGKDIYGVLPACENMPSGSAIHPGDIVKAYNGKTIEVINTDAEGRLTLADALSYAEKNLKPALMIDLATLTGACMVALGKEIAGLFGNNKKIVTDFQKTAEKESESLWPMPLYQPYAKSLKSDIADIKNVGGTGYGGAITAALFLQEFVEKTDWLHIDIAGPSLSSDQENGVFGKGGTGWGLTTLIEYIINYNHH